MATDATRLKPGLTSERFCRYVLPLCLWMAFVFFMSTKAGSARATNEPLLRALALLWPEVAGFSHDQEWVLVFLTRKLGHLFEFGILTALVIRAVQQDDPRWRWRSAAVALAIAVLYALADEWHQSFVPSRSADLRDVVVDTLGAIASLAVAWIWYRGRDPQLPASR